jgi:hypothetical protein
VSTLEQVATELYSLDLGSFTAARTALVKELRTQDKELAEAVSALPKPMVSAWAVNRFARERADELDDLLALGEQLREAQSSLAGDRMKALTANATALVQRTLKAIARVASNADAPLSDALLGQVEQTLRAALADPDAAAAVRAGVLVKPLSSGGFGPVDLSGAVALTPAARPTRVAGPRLSVVRPTADDRRDEARRGAERALEKLARVEAELAERDRELQAATAQHDEATQRLEELRAEVEEAQRAERSAAGKVREAKKAQEEAARASARAADAAQRAKQAVDALH